MRGVANRAFWEMPEPLTPGPSPPGRGEMA
ncbi:MAG: hypothetical protein QOH04_1345, partial [Sphingomonadales bacterium]|nr:hypothetical protein [Sphingomonadales bacterium]